jgi:hypothetical protein
MSKIEVQMAHEKTEWAYAVYVMHIDDGCQYSQRFEYDADIPGDRARAKEAATADYKKMQSENAGCTSYRDC